MNYLTKNQRNLPLKEGDVVKFTGSWKGKPANDDFKPSPKPKREPKEKAPRFTRKHYIKTAEEIASSPREGRRGLISSFIKKFSQDNKRFDSKRFTDAAKGDLDLDESLKESVWRYARIPGGILGGAAKGALAGIIPGRFALVKDAALAAPVVAPIPPGFHPEPHVLAGGVTIGALVGGAIGARTAYRRGKYHDANNEYKKYKAQRDSGISRKEAEPQYQKYLKMNKGAKIKGHDSFFSGGFGDIDAPRIPRINEGFFTPRIKISEVEGHIQTLADKHGLTVHKVGHSDEDKVKEKAATYYLEGGPIHPNHYVQINFEPKTSLLHSTGNSENKLSFTHRVKDPVRPQTLQYNQTEISSSHHLEKKIGEVDRFLENESHNRQMEHEEAEEKKRKREELRASVEGTGKKKRKRKMNEMRVIKGPIKKTNPLSHSEILAKSRGKFKLGNTDVLVNPVYQLPVINNQFNEERKMFQGFYEKVKKEVYEITEDVRTKLELVSHACDADYADLEKLFLMGVEEGGNEAAGFQRVAEYFEDEEDEDFEENQEKLEKILLYEGTIVPMGRYNPNASASSGAGGGGKKKYKVKIPLSKTRNDFSTYTVEADDPEEAELIAKKRHGRKLPKGALVGIKRVGWSKKTRTVGVKKSRFGGVIDPGYTVPADEVIASHKREGKKKATRPGRVINYVKDIINDYKTPRSSYKSANKTGATGKSGEGSLNKKKN